MASELDFWRKYAEQQVDQRGKSADLVIPAHVFLTLTASIPAVRAMVAPYTHQDDGVLYEIRKGLDT